MRPASKAWRSTVFGRTEADSVGAEIEDGCLEVESEGGDW